MLFSQQFVDAFLQGYTETEIAMIMADLETLAKRDDRLCGYETDNPQEVEQQPAYYATAGGPGSGKSTVLETWLMRNPQKIVYFDPDQVCLKRMDTYITSLSALRYASAPSNHAAQQAAYEKWRAASNYIACTLGNRAYDRGYSMAHGTTSTNPKVEFLYQTLQKKNYSINFLLCYAEDELRKDSISLRENEQAFVQVDPAEVISKGDAFPKMFPVYFKYVNETGGEMQFYWHERMQHGKLPEACARYAKADGLTVLDEADWRHFCDRYARDVQRLQLDVCPEMEPFLREMDLQAADIAALRRVGFLAAGWSAMPDSLENEHEQKESLAFRHD